MRYEEVRHYHVERHVCKDGDSAWFVREMRPLCGELPHHILLSIYSDNIHF